MKRYDTYVFDLDGTLLDTLGDLHTSVNYALATYGMKKRTLDEVRRFVGNGVRLLVERAVPESTPCDMTERVFETFREHYEIHSMDTTAPYPGIIEMLDRLKARECRMAVVSNKLYEATQALVSHFFGDYIDVAIGERADIRRKPAPDSVFEAMRLLGMNDTKFHDIVYVGDSEVDIATARNANLPCISVLWGFRERDFLIENGADMFVTTPDEIQ